MVNGDFLISIWSSRLKIDFSTSDPPIDQLFLGSDGKDPLPTCHRRWVSRVGSDGLGWWVGFQFCLDTPSDKFL